MDVGIDDLAIYIPKLYLDTKEFSEYRGIDVEKIQKGLEINKMAIPDSNQDAACMAANACLKLLQKNNLTPDKIGRLYVSTESALDETKAMNSNVIGMLEDRYGYGEFAHCGGIETKFACVSGSYALYDNTNWIRADESDGKYAIVVLTDVAKYDKNSPGEQTQGAGSVALLLCKNPRLLKYDPKVNQTEIRDEFDFFRPFGKPTPIVKGHYSNILYQSMVEKAFRKYKKRVEKTKLITLKENDLFLDHIDYINIHIPYPGMGKKTLANLLKSDLRDSNKWDSVAEQIDEPEPYLDFETSNDVTDEFVDRYNKFNKKIRQLDLFKKFFSEKLKSSLITSRQVGNLYTASLLMGFRSSLEYEHKNNVDLTDKRFLFCAYGSGASAMVYSGVISENYKEIVKPMNFDDDMGKREMLSMDNYEKLHNEKFGINESIIEHKNEFVKTKITDDNEIIYSYQ